MSPPVQALAPSPPIAPVSFRFAVHDHPEVTWGVRSFRLDEALSRPYRLHLEVIGEAPEGALEELLGASCGLTLDRGGAPREIAGILQSIELRGGGEGAVGLALTIVPALALLAERRDRRIWEQATVIEIVDAVVGDHLAAFDRGHRWALSGSYPARERCIQRGESDLELIARVLADEGIHYRFEIDDEPAEGAPLELPYIERGAGTAACEALHELRWRRRLTTTASTLRAWSWTRASEPADELV
ncbi:MAG: hypothetical protein H6710_18900, partial [Myxococcales bacterium]|nr:hypothetical protein [Myxococcales bacterium]